MSSALACVSLARANASFFALRMTEIIDAALKSYK